MLRELFDRILETGRQQQAIQLLHPPQEPEHVYLFRHNDGEIERVEAEPEPCAFEAANIATLCAVVKEKGKTGESAIWYDRSGVVGLLDCNRRDCVKLSLAFSEPMKELQRWEASKVTHSQRDFVLILRHKFRGCLGQTDRLLDIIRQIKWTVGDEGQSAIQHGKQSLGRKLTAEVYGVEAIPEEATFVVPVFEGIITSLQYPVSCAIEPLPQSQSFQVLPFPGQIEAAIAAAERHIGTVIAEELASDDVSVYYGQP